MQAIKKELKKSMYTYMYDGSVQFIKRFPVQALPKQAQAIGYKVVMPNEEESPDQPKKRRKGPGATGEPRAHRGSVAAKKTKHG